MKYRIIPYGCRSWLVTKGVWPFKWYLNKSISEYTWEHCFFVDEDTIHWRTFFNVEEAKEFLKTSIIVNGFKLARKLQAKKRTKLHSKDQPIIIPPWK